jgi:hypothetical protein
MDQESGFSIPQPFGLTRYSITWSAGCGLAEGISTPRVLAMRVSIENDLPGHINP